MYRRARSADTWLTSRATARKLRRASKLKREKVDVESVQCGKRSCRLSHLQKRLMPLGLQPVGNAGRTSQPRSQNPACPAKSVATEGRGDGGSLESVGTGKRSTNITTAPPQPALPHLQPIAEALQATQSPSQNSRNSVVAGVSGGTGEGQNQKSVRKAKIPLPIVKPLPAYQGLRSFRVLMTSAKPPLAPLARLSSAHETVREKQQALNNANIQVLARAACMPASGSLVISSSARGRQDELSLFSVLATLPPSKSIHEPPCSTLADEGVTTQCDAGKSIERTIDSRSANSMPVCRFAGPIAQSIISPTKSNVEHSCLNAGESVSVGKGVQNTPNSIALLDTGKRLGRISSTADPSSLLATQQIGKALQADQALSRNPVQEVVADTSARREDGLKLHKQNVTLNAKKSLTIENALPEDRGWGSIRILTEGI